MNEPEKPSPCAECLHRREHGPSSFSTCQHPEQRLDSQGNGPIVPHTGSRNIDCPLLAKSLLGIVDAIQNAAAGEERGVHEIIGVLTYLLQVEETKRKEREPTACIDHLGFGAATVKGAETCWNLPK